MLTSFQMYCLSVSPSPSMLSCGTTTVTFTFDCSFNGTVLVNNSNSGVSFSGATVKSVTAGSLTFDVNVNSNAATSFSLNFVIIGSDNISCANVNDSANAAFTHDCILPPNNDCANAAVLNISTSSCTASIFATNNSSSSGSTPSCSVSGYNDLWYTFNANNDTVNLEIPNVPGTVGFYALYDDCPSSGGAELQCSIIIPASTGTSFELLGLNVGSDYIIQTLFLPGNSGQDQEICIHSTTPNTPCPTNVIVSDAGPNFPNMSYTSSQEIITNGACNITTGGLIYNAGQSVTLNAGFDSGPGSFEIMIGGCTP